MFRALALALTALTVLTTTGVAGASSGKQRVVVDAFVDHYAFTVGCAPFGPYAFSVEVAGDARIRVTDVLARDGSLLQSVLHIQASETNTNSVSGKSLQLHGAIQEVWDYASNTRTVSGAIFVGTGAGGTWVQDTGRITMTLDTRIAQFVAGPHEAFFGGGIDPVACAALAGS